MRYVIIPLLIILYIVWSYYSIKHLIKVIKKIKRFPQPYELNEGTSAYIALHIALIFLSIIFGTVLLCIKYW